MSAKISAFWRDIRAHYRVAGTLCLVALLLIGGCYVGLRMSKFVEQIDTPPAAPVWEDVAPEQWTAVGYRRDGQRFTNEAGDAWLLLDGVDQYVESVRLSFAEPLDKDLAVQVFYTVGGTAGYTENHSVRRTARKGATELVVQVRRETEALRVDIGDTPGRVFALSAISLNSVPDTPVHARLSLYRWGLYGLLLLALLGTAALLLWGVRLEWVLLYAGLLLGLCYLFALTPASPPDEIFQYQRAYRLSNTLLLRDRRNNLAAHFDYHDYEGHSNVASGYLRLMDEAFRPTGGMNYSVYPFPTRRFPAPGQQVFPAAVGVSLGRLLGWGFLGVFYLGRLTNLLFYLGCGFVAVRRARTWKPMFLLAALVPMALHQAGSYSFDSVLNGTALVLLSWLVYAIYDAEKVSRWDYAVLLVSGVLLAPMKIVYTPLVLLYFLIPRQKFGSDRAFWGRGLLLLAGCVGLILATRLPALVDVAGASEIAQESRETVQLFTLSTVLADPVNAVRVVLRTFVTFGREYLLEAFGRVMSGRSLLLSGAAMYGYMLLLAVTALYRGRDGALAPPPMWHKLCYLLEILAVAGLCAAAMLIGWTPLGSAYVEGIQGRYFLPLIPLAALLLRNRTLVLTRNPTVVAALGAVLVNAYVINTIVNVTI